MISFDFSTIIDPIVLNNKSNLIGESLKDDLNNLAKQLIDDAKIRLQEFANAALEDSKNTQEYIKWFQEHKIVATPTVNQKHSKTRAKISTLSRKENPSQYSLLLSKTIKDVENNKTDNSKEIDEKVLLNASESICKHLFENLFSKRLQDRLRIKDAIVPSFVKLDSKEIVTLLLKKDKEALFSYWMYHIENKTYTQILSQLGYGNLETVKKAVKRVGTLLQTGNFIKKIEQHFHFEDIPAETYFKQNKDTYTFCADMNNMEGITPLRNAYNGFIANLDYTSELISSIDGNNFARIKFCFDEDLKCILFGINKTSMIGFNIIDKKYIVMSRAEFKKQEETIFTTEQNSYLYSSLGFYNILNDSLFDYRNSLTSTPNKQAYEVFDDNFIDKRDEIFKIFELKEKELFERFVAELPHEKQKEFVDSEFPNRFMLKKIYKENGEFVPWAYEEHTKINTSKYEALDILRTQYEKRVQDNIQRNKAIVSIINELLKQSKEKDAKRK